MNPPFMHAHACSKRAQAKHSHSNDNIISSIMSNEEGISKKQQKKLAKKAEKDAKKSGAKPTGDGGAKVVPSKPSTTSAPPPPTPEPPTLRLSHADDSPSTWKVLWASELYNVPIKTLRGKSSFPLAHGPSLQYGEQHVMGGNSMAKAVSMLSGSVISSSEMDEWCEWERTKLRHAPTKALPHLEQALQTCGGHHLVHHTTTVADISIVSTLASLSLEYSPIIQAYLACHAPALEKAQAAVTCPLSAHMRQTKS